MLVVGGYLITYNQLSTIGRRRGLIIEDGNASILNADFRRKGIGYIYALPVDYPRSTLRKPGVPGILIATQRRDDYLIRLEDCEPLFDVPFVAVPDPLGKYNEYGYDYD